MTHTKSNVVQYNACPSAAKRRREYYPFGMQTANSWVRENTLDNNFLANGGTELNKTSNFYDLEYRNYDPVLGRMIGVDPMATTYASLTPYNYSFNDPVTFVDVNGANPRDSGPYAGNSAYYYAMQGPDGMSPGQESLMDPFGSRWTPTFAGGYGPTGYDGSYSLSGIISQYNLNYGGPMLVTPLVSRDVQSGSWSGLAVIVVRGKLRGETNK